MSMLITINRKTSMHLFAQNNHGISELFLATLRVERNPKKSENSTDGNQKMTNVCQNGFTIPWYFVSWLATGSANFVLKRAERL